MDQNPVPLLRVVTEQLMHRGQLIAQKSLQRSLQDHGPGRLVDDDDVVSEADKPLPLMHV